MSSNTHRIFSSVITAYWCLVVSWVPDYFYGKMEINTRTSDAILVTGKIPHAKKNTLCSTVPNPEIVHMLMSGGRKVSMVNLLQKVARMLLAILRKIFAELVVRLTFRFIYIPVSSKHLCISLCSPRACHARTFHTHSINSRGKRPTNPLLRGLHFISPLNANALQICLRFSSRCS